MPGIELIVRREAAAERWKATPRRVRQNSGYLVEGPLTYSTLTSEVR